MPLIEANGVDLYYEETGDGPPLLLVPGLGGNTLGWDPLPAALAERFRVIAFDNRGAGRSAAPPGPYTMRQLAGDAAALLDRLGGGRAHVVGLSMGGMIGQELALARPELVDRLVLYATYARPRPAVHGPWLTAWAEARAREMDPVQLSLWLMPWFMTPAFIRDYDQVEAALALWTSDPYPAPAHGIAAQAAACMAHDALDRLPAIAAPTLALVGPDDIVTPVSCSRELVERIPGARLQVLERGGHVPHWEYPEAVAAALLAFLAA